MVTNMNLLLIAKSNMKKNKNMTITLVLLIIFASILLYIGTSVIWGMDTFLDEKNKELNGSDFSVMAPMMYHDDLSEIVNHMDGIEQKEVVKTVSIGSTSFQNISNEDESQHMGCLFLNADQQETISRLEIVDKGDAKLDNSIILPYYLKVAKNYKTGDEMTITYGGITHKFIVYGFYEDIMFAIPSNFSYYKCYVFDQKFNELYSDETTQSFLLKTILQPNMATSQFNDDFAKEMNEKLKSATSLVNSLDFDSMKVGVGAFFVIMMILLITFSIIVIMIALTVIRFAIVTYIEGNIKNIGSMEALGYTGRELARGTVIQFILITLVSTAIGVLLSISCTRVVTNLVSSSIGLQWKSEVNPIVILVSFAIILFMVWFITSLTARRIKKITPIMALRDGIETHNFRKNYFPLHKGKTSLNATIGFKSLMQNMKQNITMFTIVFLMSFVCVFAFTTNYNFVVSNTAMLRMIGIEKSHLMVGYMGENSYEVFNEIGKMDNVKKTIRMNRNSLTLYNGEKQITPAVNICENYDLLEIVTIVEGRYPIHDNEIAVTGLVQKGLGIEIGDAVSIEGSEGVEDFILVGITQQINNLGKGACITEKGMQRLDADYIPTSLYVYLEDSEGIPSVMKTIEDRYQGEMITVLNMEEEFDSIMESFNQAISSLSVGGIVITLMIISLVLFLLIRIKLLKERMRIGVMKAVGFTTKQLILQIICSFSPVCILGALLGTVAALFLINPILAALLSMVGSIQNSHFEISIQLAAATFVSISLFSVFITTLVARAARNITPCELFR